MKTTALAWIRLALKTRAARHGNRLAATGMIAAAVGLGLGAPAGHLECSRRTALERPTPHASARMSWKSNLGGSRTGRVILHTMCLIRHPQKAHWHWHGILREFAA